MFRHTTKIWVCADEPVQRGLAGFESDHGHPTQNILGGRGVPFPVRDLRLATACVALKMVTERVRLETCMIR